MSFESMGLPAALTRALSDASYTTATEVQLQAIPPALQGRDLRVQSHTGSGKTASFMLPLLNRVLSAQAERRGARGARALVLTPTRELAQQVARAAQNYGRHVRGLKVATIVGGVPYGFQLKMLRATPDIIIATPGRLMDLMASGNAVLSSVEAFVLDEADRMLDLGFIDDIHHIAQALPAARQTLMYSATFGGRVGALADELLKDPLRIETSAHTETHADIEQRLHWADDLRHKNALLEHLLAGQEVEQALVFTSTQRDADWLAEHLEGMGHAVAALHGGMPQGRRNRVLRGLRERELRVLVATDVAARGIDVPTISHVINYGLPMKPEDYVHRIGRTGRAGRAGLAVTLAERRDAGMIQRIQRFTTQRIPPAVIAGLEPKRVEEPRAAPFGAKPFRKGFQKPSGERSGERSYDRSHDRPQDRPADPFGQRFAPRPAPHARPGFDRAAPERHDARAMPRARHATGGNSPASAPSGPRRGATGAARPRRAP
jgi:superfamily II DNA/RNA helicase